MKTLVTHGVLAWCVLGTSLGCSSEPQVSGGQVAPMKRGVPGAPEHRWSAPSPGACVVTMCMTGAVDQDSGSNSGFERLCRDEVFDPGRVEDCNGPGEGCRHTFDSFLKSPERTLYSVLFDVLDANDDGRVGLDDPACEVNLVGFSWGGVNALRMAQALSEDAFVVPERREVARLVMLDPYQPGQQKSMVVPDTVQRTLVWRHTVSPPTDCSSRAPLGPYEGFAPICGEGTSCEEVDVSMEPERRFVTARGVTMRGEDVGHCDVPYVAHGAVVRFMASD